MRIGLTLGGGSARGLAHIAMLEVFDELGIKPSIITGCSIGALIGAGYAGGMTALEIREHALQILSRRIDMLRHVFGTRQARFHEILALGGFRSFQIDGRKLAEVVLPAHLPHNIEDCKIPFKVITADYEAMEEVVLKTGSMIEAVGASMAIPGIISAPRINGRIHIDGGTINPVPFDHAREGSDIVVAIDVAGAPRATQDRSLSNMELIIGASLIMFHHLAELRRRHNPPEIYFTPQVGNFGSADFFRVAEILKAAEPSKDVLKRQIEALLNASI